MPSHSTTPPSRIPVEDLFQKAPLTVREFFREREARGGSPLGSRTLSETLNPEEFSVEAGVRNLNAMRP